MMKRTFDITCALVGLLLLSPLFVIIPILIKLDSSGPVFYRQTRVGRGFRPFTILKFRTMRVNSDLDGNLLTVSKDPRITRVGQRLRALKLDELPQLVNILLGEMSVVGPRPEVKKYVEKFREQYQSVLAIRPGLTDLASLKYIDESAALKKYGNPEEAYVQTILPEKIRLGELYLKNASFFFDGMLILETILRMAGFKRVFLNGPQFQQRNNNRNVSGERRNGILHRWAQVGRLVGVVSLHLGLIALANYLAFVLRFDGKISDPYFSLFITTLPFLLGIQGLTFYFFRLYEGLWRYAGIWELRNIVGAVVASTFLFGVIVNGVTDDGAYPFSIYAIHILLLVMLLGGIRFLKRITSALGLRIKDKQVLIIGAGDAGEMIVRDMHNSPFSEYDPIGFIDDDLLKIGQSIHGVKVLGTRDDLQDILLKYQPKEILVAIPHADSHVVRKLVQNLEAFDVPIKTLPTLGELMNGNVTINQIRPLAIEDLLERTPIGLDHDRVKDMIEGKRVMVTGAGGSIGSELCRQLALLEPSALILFEQYENGLYAIGHELLAQQDAPPIHQLVGDITDSSRVHSVMADFRPHIVFHAAAHKHVPLMEGNPCEAVKNNIFGTQTVALAASRYRVQKFVMISTDKAVNPTSVMGATKRVAELIVQDIVKRTTTNFVTVRFGNVLGSNGSVVPRFLEQIRQGGPVTVTHPEIRRYFMLIPEAVGLVLQAASLGEQGALYVLEMGEQIKLVDMARNLIRLSGLVPDEEIPISFVGLRPGEKLYEELVGFEEKAEPSPVEKIHRVRSNMVLDFAVLSKKLNELERVALLGDTNPTLEGLQSIVPTFQTENIPKIHTEVSAKVNGSTDKDIIDKHTVGSP